MRTAAGLTAPITVAELELAEPVSVTEPVARYADDEGCPAPAAAALVLVRVHGRPMGSVLVETVDGRVDPQRCAEQAWASLRPAIVSHLGADGLPPVPPLASADGKPPLCAKRPASAVPISVVVATRERPRLLAACLDSLAAVDYPEFEVVVVDNDPVGGETAQLVHSRAGRGVRYVVESRRGLAAAHNRGLAVAAGSIVAFTDDDVLVDPGWLWAISKAMGADPATACVTGLIMPAELATEAQLMLELHGNFGKGFESRTFNLWAGRPDDPLFPFTVGKLGSGANMAFDKDALGAVGGFDTAIGAGTVARGGDDLAALFSILAAGYTLAYEPAALVWHRHHRDLGSLTKQAYGYGVGLGAYLASALTQHPRMIGGALSRLPAGLRYALRSDSPRNQHSADVWPQELVRLERRGMAFGPVAYAVSRWRTRGVPRLQKAKGTC
ncbi:MAG: glycosyltransferase family 2 protein [Streptosporangiaceae bacterium]